MKFSFIAASVTELLQGWLQVFAVIPFAFHRVSGDKVVGPPGIIMTSERAFSRTDLLVLIGVLSAISVFTVAGTSDQRRQSQRLGCVNGMRQIGQAFRSWAYDHDNAHPWAVPYPVGTRTRGNTWEHFAVLQNELPSPRIFVCPSDGFRRGAVRYDRAPGGFSHSLNQNNTISYFNTVHPVLDQPSEILLGDRNFAGGVANVGCSYIQVAAAYLMDPTYASQGRLKWTNALHGADAGNLAFGDGSVLMSNNKLFNRTIVNQITIGDGNHRNSHFLPPY